jgi:glucose-6-phosphate 1-dehydrogenase
VFVLFGATGDLAKRMVLPAFYRLAIEGLLPRTGCWSATAAATSHETSARTCTTCTSSGRPDEGRGRDSPRLRFAGGGFSSDRPGSLLGRARRGAPDWAAARSWCTTFAVPPVAFPSSPRRLGRHGLAEGARVVYEKPFGTSPPASGARPGGALGAGRGQVYRIDHFLGKEATQDLHVLRFANGCSHAMWDREHVESVQIDVPETLGVRDRAGFYDATGAVLDMLVTHLFQVRRRGRDGAAGQPGRGRPAGGRERSIRSFRPLDPAEVVLGQFDGYRTCRVAAGSTPDTVRRGPAVDRQRPLARRAVLPAHRQADGGDAQRVSLILRSRRAACRQLPADGNVLSFSLAGDGEIEPVRWWPSRPGPALVIARRRRVPLRRPARRRPAAAVRPADPRRC